MSYIYLDNNATTPLKPEVKAAMVSSMDVYGNASSIHAAGRDARMALDDARRKVGGMFGVRPEQVVFTSGGTESNVMAIIGLFAESNKKRIISCTTEHKSVLETLKKLEEQGADVLLMPVDHQGNVDMAVLAAELAKGDVAFTTFMWANSETAVCHNIEEIASLCKQHGAPFHVDAVQIAGKKPIKLMDGVTSMSISFHKFGGPKGVGAIVLDGNAKMQALMPGAQERNRRSGTENILGIIGAGVCAEVAPQTDWKKIEEFRIKAERGLKLIANEIEIAGENANRLPHAFSFVAPGMDAQTTIMSMDMAGVCVSQGSACSSGRQEPSHVLKAMGFSDEDANSGIRVALGWHNREADIDTFLETFKNVYSRMNKG